MKNFVQIKQITNEYGKSLNMVDSKSGKPIERTNHPNSIIIKYPKKNNTGEWITGLTEKEEKEYGAKLKVDLSPNSDFWCSLDILLVDKTNDVGFNLENPLHYIKYKCALANKFFAENKDRLLDPDFHVEDCFLYVYDPEGDLKRETVLRELKDECTSLIYQMRTQKEKQFYILYKLGEVVNENWTASQMYKYLSNRLTSLKKQEHLENFRDCLKADNTELQIQYLFDKAVGKSILYSNNQWVFGQKNLGNDKIKALETIKTNPELLKLLDEELNILL